MRYKENRTVDGVLKNFFDENGKSCLFDEVFIKDALGNLTDQLREGDEIIPMTEDEIAINRQKIVELEAQQAVTQYQRDRAREYPDFRDYLDGVVKGDQAQIDAYIAACQAVKAKYPKP